ncbi:MAG TPA: energy transducer TonB [Chthoniobacterales bacterium]|nr:energy transducer TonB [Chthoniobacterales bacterium]
MTKLFCTGFLACVASSPLLAQQQVTPRVKMDDVVYKVGPRYPDRLQRARIAGTGMFRMIIDFKTGKVTNVVVLKSTESEALDREAMFALRQWRFKPGKLTKADMPITFHNGSEPLVLPPGSKLVPNR